MDVVYPYKRAPYDLELRLSLRSLVNLPHDRVIVAGERPAILGHKTTHIAVDRDPDRYRSSTTNIVAALERTDVSDEFIVMHDDIFVLKPWTFRHAHRGTVEEYLHTTSAGGDYRLRAEHTADILRGHGVAEPLFFGLHTPTVYSRDRFLEVAREFGAQSCLLRTIYYNLFPAPCERGNDVKIRGWRPPPDDAVVISIGDESVGHIGFRSWAKRVFPDPSPYEIGAEGPCLILGRGAGVWDDLADAANRPFAAVIASPEAAKHWPGTLLDVAYDDAHAEHVAALYGFNDTIWCGRSTA